MISASIFDAATGLSVVHAHKELGSSNRPKQLDQVWIFGEIEKLVYKAYAKFEKEYTRQ